jgi:MoaA/NifB/PqqE/SkfB family radical SAM enzyme
LKHNLFPNPEKIRKPKYLIYLVTDLCNLRCEMCGIWKKKATNSELSVDEANSLFSDPWLSDVEFIQFNGGEPTIRPDIESLCHSVVKHLPKLKQINITTNGYYTTRCLSLVSSLKEVCDQRSINLSVQISLDGDPSTHDKIRGKENAFKQALETVAALKDRGILVFLNATISKTNYSSLNYLESLAKQLNIQIGYIPVMFRDRNYSDESHGALALQGDSAEAWRLFCANQAQNKSINGYYYSILHSMSTGEKRPIGCIYILQGGCIITPDGSVRYCPNAPFLPKLREYGLEEIMKDPANTAIRKQLSQSFCSQCIPYGPNIQEIFGSLGKYLRYRYGKTHH